MKRDRPQSKKIPLLNPPLAGRITPLFTVGAEIKHPYFVDDDNHVLEVVANFPGLLIYKDGSGYIVDAETEVKVKLDGSGDYLVRHQRTRTDRAGALCHLLSVVVPAEFRDLLSGQHLSKPNG